VKRAGQHFPPDGQDAAGFQNRALKGTGHFGHRGDEEVAETMAIQARIGADGRKAVVKELGDQPLIVRQRRDAVAEVAGRKHAQGPTQAPGTPAVIGDGDDGRDVGRVGLQPAQEGRQPVPASDRDDFRPLTALPMAVERLHNLMAVPNERREECPVQPDQSDCDQPQAYQDQEWPPGPKGQKGQGQVAVDARKQVKLPEKQADPQADQQDAQRQRQQPALDADAREKPFDMGTNRFRQPRHQFPLPFITPVMIWLLFFVLQTC
jgi:hypothetical protein